MKLLLLLLLSIACKAQNLIPDNDIRLSGNRKPFTVSAATDSSIAWKTIEGKQFIHFVVSKYDPDQAEGFRSEIGYPFWKGKKNQTITITSLFPSRVKYNTKRYQWWGFHDMPDFAIGETWRSPSICSYIERDSMYVFVAWSALRFNSLPNGNTKYDGRKTFNLGKVEKDRVAEWTIRVRFSYMQDGFLSITKDGKPVLYYAGANCYNDENYETFKAGVYWWTRDEEGNENDRIELYLGNIIVR